MAFAALDPASIGRKYAAIGYGVQDALGTSGTRRTGSETLQQIAGPVFGAIYGSFEDFVEEGAPVFFPEIDPDDPAGLAELHSLYDFYSLLEVEAWFGNGPGDAQSCFGDSGGPMVAQLGGRTTVFGVTSWGFSPDYPLCALGGAYATLNPLTLDFIHYEELCPLIPREGTCDGLTAVRCATALEGGYRELRTDCSDLGLVCGLDEAGEVGCVEDPCEGLPEEGQCDGTVAVRCSGPDEGPRHVVSTECADQGLICGADASGTAACIDDGIPNCDHDTCTVGPRLDASCNECTANICAVDPFCCDSYWDSICVSEVESECGVACPDAPPVTPEDLAARGR